MEAHTDLFEKAAALLPSLTVNRPPVDGNKRMAWTSTVVFLDFNSTEMVGADQDESYRYRDESYKDESYKVVIEVATCSLDDPGRIAGRLRALHEAM
ncbi:hypothetical protein OG883_26825 [Streptomyces sp. NBC_01142]|uniref:Fic family protein n=1 Tax=Streptomyces sp. NBC_01142 TaxID=2975865 RepID=UPI002256D76A|nr:Fic family protein [Streptomyces sp. NBC_01142]MCX4823430.1 hypothetical protein [Streptomyces sp. NBC_01142]